MAERYGKLNYDPNLPPAKIRVVRLSGKACEEAVARLQASLLEAVDQAQKGHRSSMAGFLAKGPHYIAR